MLYMGMNITVNKVFTRPGKSIATKTNSRRVVETTVTTGL